MHQWTEHILHAYLCAIRSEYSARPVNSTWLHRSVLRKSCEGSYFFCRREAQLQAPASRKASLTGEVLQSMYLSQLDAAGIRERASLATFHGVPGRVHDPLFPLQVV